MCKMSITMWDRGVLLLLTSLSFSTQDHQQFTCKPPDYENPTVEKSAKPMFPDIVKQSVGSKNATTTELCIEVLIDPLGRVAGVQYVAGDSLLLYLAKQGGFDETVRQWRFEPKDQYPPGRKGYITFRFHLVPDLDDTAQEVEHDESVVEVLGQQACSTVMISHNRRGRLTRLAADETLVFGQRSCR